MIRINKAERDYLIAHGIKTGENGISRTYSHNTSWYMAETKKNMACLDKYYKEKIVEVH